MTWLLSYLFPLRVMLPRARKLGSVTLQSIADGSWSAYIRPPTASGRSVNSWHAQGATMSKALRACLVEARTFPRFGFFDNMFAPKLGGKEFDDDDQA